MAKAKTESAGETTLSQADMVRAAVDELGMDAKPRAIQEHIRTKFNKTLPTTTISNYKSVMKRRGEGGGTNGRRRRGEGNIRIDDLEAVRGLFSRLGAEHVRRLVDVLA